MIRLPTFFFSDADGNDYKIEYTGNNLSILHVGGVSQSDVNGNISSATLYKVNGIGDETELASMSVVDANGQPTTILMKSAAEFTPDSIQNNNNYQETTHLTETGDSGVDNLLGSDYNDALSGYGGHDTLTGGGGNDKFEFIASGSTTYDFVTDFTRHHDKLDLDARLGNFKGLHNSSLANVFHDITNSSETSKDRLLYNHNTGALFYDRDGAGRKAPTEIAVLTNHAHINYSDIKIIG